MRERLATLRIAIGLYGLVWTLACTPELVALTRLPANHWKPTGIAKVISAPLPSGVALAIVIATLVLMAAFTLGYRFRITGPLAAAALLWTLTYRNSWGLPFHTENLLVLHVVALACAPAADTWAMAPRRDGGNYRWAIRLMAALTVATYVLAGIAKLRLAGAHWVNGEMLRNQIAVDNLRKALLGSPTAVFATPLLEHPDAFIAVSVLTLVVELGAPLVFLHRRIAAIWAVAAWGFHVGVVLMMNIWFPYPLLGLAYLPLFEVERIGPWMGQRSSWLRSKLRP